MEIYLLRHGAAESAVPGTPDSARPLAEHGRQDLRAVLRLARAGGARPSLILSSPYLRALESAGIARETLGCSCAILQAEAFTPNSSPYDAWDEIRARKTEASVLIAAHQPLIGSLAAFLLGSNALDVAVPAAALIRVDCERFGAHPKGVLMWMLTPELARDGAGTPGAAAR